jgi:hypothetical protein
VTTTLTFDSENSERTVQLNIADDDADEEQESFLARLSLDPSETSAVEIRPNMTAILIDDNDGMVVRALHACKTL